MQYGVRTAGSVALWGASIFLSALFMSAALTKLFVPLDVLAQAWLWVGDTPPVLVRTIAVVEIAGALGILFPAGLRLWPKLGVAAAIGLCATAIGAVTMHASRGEFDGPLAVNAALLAAAVAIARMKWLPIEARMPSAGTWVSGSLALVALPGVWFLLAHEIVHGTAVGLALYGAFAGAMVFYNYRQPTAWQ